MSSTYSTNLGIELIGTGDQAGAWGITTNSNLGTLIEQAISGYVTQTVSDDPASPTTLTIPNGASGVARNMTIEFTGALTAARNVIVPANKKLYFVYNNTTGGYAITVKVAGQTGVTVNNGAKAILVSNGTDIVTASAGTGDITFSTNTISTANSNENMILDPNGSGVVFVNCTSSDWGGQSAAMEIKADLAGKVYPIIIESPSYLRGAVMWNQGTSGDNNFWNFSTESPIPSFRGSITYNRAGGAVAYNTTSDYRSKDVYGPVENSGAQLDALKVYRGKMHGATLEKPVMIAHELAEVAPYAVNGEKDAVNEDGSPKYQQVDFTMLVPLLVAEIQSLRARVAALEAK